nr:uncharacterized protein CI109_005677 [Kwoniella shandongensis]KAA5525930.1 hypothetical protein CI109_005677 [Kwoniella shandongensis]
MTSSTAAAPPEDIILSMAHTPTEDYMQQIVQRVKTHEFRKRLYPPSILGIWFYETSPTSSITHICEIGPTHVRSRDSPLVEDGIGHEGYNAHHPDWKGYDYAYPLVSCWRIKEPISLARMKEHYGLGGAPRGMVYVPRRMKDEVKWVEQWLIWSNCEYGSVWQAVWSE